MRQFALQDFLHDLAEKAAQLTAKAVATDACAVVAFLSNGCERSHSRRLGGNGEHTPGYVPPIEERWYDYRGKIVGGITLFIVGIISIVLCCRIWKEERDKRERRRLEDIAYAEARRASEAEAKKDAADLQQLKERMAELKAEHAQMQQNAMGIQGWGAPLPQSVRSFPTQEMELSAYGQGERRPQTQPLMGNGFGLSGPSQCNPHAPQASYGPPQPQAWPTDYRQYQSEPPGFMQAQQQQSSSPFFRDAPMQNYGGHTAPMPQQWY